MSWIITGAQPIPAVIGEPFGGGYFAGYISHTADGNPTHALIVAPRATGATGTGYTLTTDYVWKNALTVTPGTDSLYDGKANTNAMIAAGIDDHPAAKFCVELNIGGYNDWYLPAQYEADIAYFNLKPSIAQNDIGYGINPYAVPARSENFSLDYPKQSFVSLFTTNTEEFVSVVPTQMRHWTSTGGGSTATNILFNNGNQGLNFKSAALRVRAFRRIAL